jgi:hypothetical protein
MLSSTIKLVGLVGLAAFILYLGYLFYEKNLLISIILLLLGGILSTVIIGYEISFKTKRHEAPWLFEEYKGE